MRAKDFLTEAPVSAPAVEPQTSPTAQPADGIAPVQRGSSGPAVTALQQKLKGLGYNLGRHGVDGRFGPDTEAAVRAYQHRNNLQIDGKVGPETIAKLSTAAPQAASPTKPTTRTITPKTQQLTIAQDAVTQGKVGEILDLVAGPESRGHYDMMFGSKRQPEILKMTISDAHHFQEQWRRKMGSSAMGRYQIMADNTIAYATKAGLDPETELFNPANQDKMGIVFLKEKGLERWLSGKMSDEQFLEGLSRVWAGVPSPSKGGNSYYGNVGLNKVKTQLDMTTALNNLRNINGTTATA